MIAHRSGELLGTRWHTGDENPRLHARFLIALLALAVDQANAAQALPIGVTLRYRFRNSNDMVNPRLDAAMSFFFGTVTIVLHARKTVVQSFAENLPNVVVQRWLVVFHRQHIVRPGLLDRGGDFFLTAHSVDGHDGPGNFQVFDEFRDRGDFVRFAVTSLLTQEQTVFTRPSADHVQRTFARSFVEGAAGRFAVNLHQTSEGGFGDGLHPFDESLLQSARTQQRKDPTKGIVGGNAMRKFEKGFEEIKLANAILANLDPGVGAGNDGQDGDGNDVP